MALKFPSIPSLMILPMIYICFTTHESYTFILYKKNVISLSNAWNIIIFIHKNNGKVFSSANVPHSLKNVLSREDPRPGLAIVITFRS